MSEGNRSRWGKAAPPSRRRRVWSARGLVKPPTHGRLTAATVSSLALHAFALAVLLQLVTVQFGRPTQDLFVFTDDVSTTTGSDVSTRGTGPVDREGPSAEGGVPGPSLQAEAGPAPQLPSRAERVPGPVAGASVLPPLGELSGPGGIASEPGSRPSAPLQARTRVGSQPAPTAPGLLPEPARVAELPPEALSPPAPGAATTPQPPPAQAPDAVALHSPVPVPSVTSTLLPGATPRAVTPPSATAAAPAPRAAPEAPAARAPEAVALDSPVPVPTVTSRLMSEAAPRAAAPPQAATVAPVPGTAPATPRAQAPGAATLASPVEVPAVTASLLAEAAPLPEAPTPGTPTAPAPRAAPAAPRAQAPDAVALVSPVPAPEVTSSLIPATAPPATEPSVTSPAPAGPVRAAPQPRSAPAAPRVRAPEGFALSSPVPVPAVTSRLAEQASPVPGGVPARPLSAAGPVPRPTTSPAAPPASAGAGTAAGSGAGLLDSPIRAPLQRGIALAPLAEQMAPTVPLPSGGGSGSGTQGTLPPSTVLRGAPSLPRASTPEALGSGGPTLPELLVPRAPGRLTGAGGGPASAGAAGTGTAPATGVQAERRLGARTVGVPDPRAGAPLSSTLSSSLPPQVAGGRAAGERSTSAAGEGEGSGGGTDSAGSTTERRTAAGGAPDSQVGSVPAGGSTPGTTGEGPATGDIARSLTGGFPGLPDRGARAGLPGVGSSVPLPGTERGRDRAGDGPSRDVATEGPGRVASGQEGRAETPGGGGQDDAGDGVRRGSVPPPPGSPFGIAITEPVNGFRISYNDPPLVVVRGRVEDRGVTSVVLRANDLRITAPVMGGWFEAVVPAVDPIIKIRAEMIAGSNRRRSEEITVHADASRTAAVLVLDWEQSENHPELDITATWRARPDQADDPMIPVPVKGLPAYSRVFFLQDMKPGVYAFSLGYRGASAPVTGTLYFGGGETKTTATQLRRVRLSGAGRTILARFLLPFGVFWDDDKWFTGRSESVDTITKFRFPEGVSWVERKGGAR